MKNKSTVLGSAAAAMGLVAASTLFNVGEPSTDVCKPLEDFSWKDKAEVEAVITDVAQKTGQPYSIDVSCTEGVYRKVKQQAQERVNSIANQKSKLKYRKLNKKGEIVTSSVDTKKYKEFVNQKLDKIK